MTQVYAALRRHAPVPLYVQIRDRIVEDIERGHLQPGDRIPSEPELVARFRVGRPTVRQALALLRHEGWASTRRGAGTFVTAARPRVSLMDFGGLTRSVEARGFRVHDEVIATGLTREVRLDVLDVEEGVSWWWVERLRRVNAETEEGQVPLCVEVDLFNLEACPDAEAAFAASGSATAVLEQACLLEATSCESSTRAIAADTRSAALLAIRRGTPLLAMERVNRATDGTVVHVVRYALRTDRVPVVDSSVSPSFGR